MILALGELSTGDLLLKIVFLVVGLGVLIKGADWFVAGSSAIAKKFKISPLIIGLTIVAFGTSAPELAVSLTASITCPAGETADIAMGNIVGSNIANLCLVLGLSAIFTPIIVKKGICKKEYPFLIITSLLLAVFSFDVILNGASKNQIIRTEGLVFIGFIAYFVYISIKGAKTDNEVNNEVVIEDMKTGKAIILFLIGLACIVVGAKFGTDGAESLAVNIGIACNVDKSLMKTLVGLTVVAVGTSLPELLTSVIAAKKGENEIALGNVIGSNIFNVLFVVGLSGSITSLGINDVVLQDIIIMIGVTLLVFVMCLSGLIKKRSGWILLGVYAIYVIYAVLRVFM